MPRKSRCTASRNLAVRIAVVGSIILGLLISISAVATAQSPAPTPSATTTAVRSATPMATATSPACNGTLINGFLIVPNNSTPNAACPGQQDVTAPGPFIVYGLNLPSNQYRLVAAGHPANLPGTTTITYLPTSGVAQGEGFVSVTVSTTYKKPTVHTLPPGATTTWAAASYLPEPGVAYQSTVNSSAQWMGAGGLYTLTIDSAHSSLTLRQAAALLVPVNLVQLQAQLSPTPPPAAPSTGSGSANRNAATWRILEVVGALVLVSAIAAALALKRRERRL